MPFSVLAVPHRASTAVRVVADVHSWYCQLSASLQQDAAVRPANVQRVNVLKLRLGCSSFLVCV